MAMITQVAKKEVKNKTRETFEKLCSTIDNVDIIKIIPDVIKAYMEPIKARRKSLRVMM